MVRLIVKNIGPIKDVDIELKKVNIFMGPQSCGKSTLAKIISFCSWLEKGNEDTAKAIAKGVVATLTQFHHMRGYFSEDSQIAYWGEDVCLFYNMPETLPLTSFGECRSEHLHEKEFVFHKIQKTTNPKVAYIPAERNFVSVVPNLKKYAEKDDSLQSFVNDWFEAKRAYTEEKPLQLGILNANYHYSPQTDTDTITTENQPLFLSQSSSGLQSVTPLLALLNYFSSGIYAENKPFSPEENQQMRNILSHVTNDLSNEMEQQLIERIRGFLQGKVYTHTQFVIEEPEQNLFPETQCKLLYSLLSALNHGKSHRMVITTHSPYTLYALNNCILANIVKEEMPKEEFDNLGCANVIISPKDIAVREIERGKMKTYGKSSTSSTIQDESGLIRQNYFNQVMKTIMNDFNTMVAYKD